MPIHHIVRRKGLITHLQNLLSNYALMALTIGVQILLVPFLLHHIGKTEFGIYILFLSLIGYAAIGVGSLTSIMPRLLGSHAAKNEQRLFAQFFTLSTLLFGIYAIIIGGIGICLLNSFPLESTNRIFPYLAYGYFVTQYLYITNRIGLLAHKKQIPANLFDIITQIVFAISCYLLVKNNLGLNGIVLSLILGQITAHILAKIYWKRSKIITRSIPNKDNWKNFKKTFFSKVSAGYVLYGMVLLTNQSDALIIGYLFSPEIAAEYYLAWKIPDVIIILLWRIPNTFVPEIIHEEAKNGPLSAMHTYKKFLLPYIGICFFCCVMYAFLGSSITTLWVGKGYIPQESYVYGLTALSAFFIASCKWPIVISHALGRPDLSLKPAIIELIGKWLIAIPLLPLMGYSAVFLGTILIYMSCVFWLYFGRMKKILYKDKDE